MIMTAAFQLVQQRKKVESCLARRGMNRNGKRDFVEPDNQELHFGFDPVVVPGARVRMQLI